MSSIPDDIYVEIFLKVPVRFLLACKSVCKTWFSIIANPDFLKMQLTIQRKNPNLILQGIDNSMNMSLNVFYSIGHDSLESLLSTDKFIDYAVELDYPFKSLDYSVQLMGCCDGLVCLWFQEKQFFSLWNPATREYKVLPKSNIHFVSIVAFGYDYKSNDYKLLACTGRLSQVYLLGLNSWKRIKTIPPYEFHFWRKSGVLVNGYFHWLAKREDSSSFVVSLDISNDIFKEIELPTETSGNRFLDLNLGVLEGRLCLFVDLYQHYYIWIMQKYGVRESWTQRYIFMDDKRITTACFFRLMWSFKGGEILIGTDRGDLVVCNPEYGSVTERSISSLTRLYREELYFESLVSLGSATYVEGEEQIDRGTK